MFDTFLGLPLHPLIVHSAVVLLPLVAIGVIAIVLKPSWRQRFAVPLLGLLVVAAGSAVVAMLSGRKLAERVGQPGRHEDLGTILAFSSIAFLLVAGGWLWWVRRDDDDAPPARTWLGWVAAVASAGILALTAMVGHTGGQAAWSDAVAAPLPAGPASTPASPVTADGSAPSSAAAGTYTVEMLDQHNSAESCWAVIDGSMYDLTDWIAQHPGGADRIIGLCGTDATAAFSNQHEGEDNPNEALSRYLLGPLS